MIPPRALLLSTSRAAFQRTLSSSTRVSVLAVKSKNMSSTSTPPAPAPWLQTLLADKRDPPRLYAWTTDNLPGHQQQTKASHPAALSPEEDAARRIYILGIGNLGRLYAAALAARQQKEEQIKIRTPVTLILHRLSLLEHWAASPRLELTVPPGSSSSLFSSSGEGEGEESSSQVLSFGPESFDVEYWTEEAPSHGPVREVAVARGGGEGGGKIRNLIVTTKAPSAVPEVDRLRRYLDVTGGGGGCTVAFAQNGMCKLWPPAGGEYVAARFGGSAGESPINWLACVTTHGVTGLGDFRSVLASPADVVVGGVMLNRGGRKGGGQERHLIETLVASPGLEAREMGRKDLWVSQLEKLCVNSVINPLTAVMRCINGELVRKVEGGKEEEEDKLPEVIDALLKEASTTLVELVGDESSEEILLSSASSSSELEALRKELEERFAFERLKKFVYGVGEKVTKNTSSMLQDVRAGKVTEVRDFNGWLVDTARYLSEKKKKGGKEEIRLKAHERLIELVEKGTVVQREDLGEVFRGLL